MVSLANCFSPSTADEIWNECNELLAQDNFSARGIMQQMNVKMVGTTDDPIDSLEHHAEIAKDGSFTIKSAAELASGQSLQHRTGDL
ncbi:glucuronate isomerase [Escherichia coli]